jgi:hypothetical protein
MLVLREVQLETKDTVLSLILVDCPSPRHKLTKVSKEISQILIEKLI